GFVDHHGGDPVVRGVTINGEALREDDGPTGEASIMGGAAQSHRPAGAASWSGTVIDSGSRSAVVIRPSVHRPAAAPARPRLTRPPSPGGRRGPQQVRPASYPGFRAFRLPTGNVTGKDLRRYRYSTG